MNVQFMMMKNEDLDSLKLTFLAPENGWLEQLVVFLLGTQGYVSFREGI